MSNYYWRGCWWRWHIILFMTSNFYLCFRHETRISEECFKIAKFFKKTTWHGHHEMLTTFNDDLDLLRKVITGDELCVYGYDIETKAQSSQWKRSEEPRPLSSVKCEDFAHCFLRLQRRNASWILATRSYVQRRILSWRNAQNCGKTIHGFCTMITHHLTHRCLCLSFWPKTKPQLCLNHRIHRTWPPRSLSCFQNWRHRRKESVLPRLWR